MKDWVATASINDWGPALLTYDADRRCLLARPQGLSKGFDADLKHDKLVPSVMDQF